MLTRHQDEQPKPRSRSCCLRASWAASSDPCAQEASECRTQSNVRVVARPAATERSRPSSFGKHGVQCKQGDASQSEPDFVNRKGPGSLLCSSSSERCSVVNCHAVGMLIFCVAGGHHAVASTCSTWSCVVRCSRCGENRPSRHTIPTALHFRSAPSGSMNAAVGMRHDRPGLRDLDRSENGSACGSARGNGRVRTCGLPGQFSMI